ncbi:hypothetical protein GCM10022236_25420 [Microlunatus ginsengisoli]|uniref:Uncharacterized protein n=1 Tax=Microlunatus ginsengisoli TaxID=363863 RepID=A0ABP7A0K5_9ACTN
MDVDEPGDWALLMVPIAVCLVLVILAGAMGVFRTDSPVETDVRVGCVGAGPITLGCRR